MRYPADMDLVAEILDGDPVLTLEEAAAQLCLAPAYVRQLPLPRIDVVGRIRFRQSWIDAEKQRRGMQ